MIIDSLFEKVPRADVEFREDQEKFRRICLEKGMERITFTGADAEWYVDTTRRALYEFLREKSPVDGPKLCRMLQKED